MPTQMLSIGPPFTMLANVIYALPGVRVALYSDAAAPTIAQSNTVGFTANTAVTLTGGSAVLDGAFVRATADTLVVLKKV